MTVVVVVVVVVILIFVLVKMTVVSKRTDVMTRIAIMILKMIQNNFFF
jgi:hypothetical protein